jgi:hypothetical protein
MKSLSKDTKGFSVVEFLTILIVVVAVSVIGYFAFNKMQENKEANDTSSSQTTNNKETAEAPTVKSTQDLDKADAALDSSKLDDGSDASLDTELNKF